MYAVPLIALLTDFGTSDTYVGSMKGVISRIAPGLMMIDLTHEIPFGDIRRAAVSLWKERDYFPRKTIFLCIVDPGVGTSRRAILVKSGDYYFIGPDNGLFSYVLNAKPVVWELSNSQYHLPPYPSSTFHGRDIFAPAAAYLAKGVDPREFGAPISDPIILPFPRLEMTDNGNLRGEILFPDHFGNLLTSLGRFRRYKGEIHLWKPWDSSLENIHYNIENLRIHLPEGNYLHWVNTFEEAVDGQCAVTLGSSGLLEIVAKNQSAENMLGYRGGELIILETNGGN
jgi:S-adenosyl-L-methionine hydrolase (adenosine-forming)